MRLRALRLQNFRQHADTLIEFENGLTGIIGPNGAGKSTILEGIAWALYGNPVARGTRESIRFHAAPPRASVRVELDFELGPHRYRVVRGLTSAELFVDGGTAPVANSIGAVSQLIEQRLGMTSREFFTTYFTGQKDLAAMAAMGPADRGRFLSRVLGYDRLQKAQELARETRGQVIAALKALAQSAADAELLAAEVEAAQLTVRMTDGALTAATAELARAEAALAGAEPRWRESEGAQLRDLELREAIIRAAAAVTSEQRELERAAAAVREAEGVTSGLASVLAQLAPLAALRAELQQLEDRSRAAARRQALVEEIARLSASVDAASARLSQLAPAPALRAEALASLVTARATATAAIEAATARRTEWARDLQEAETRRNQKRDEYADIRTQLDRLRALGVDAPCPTCLRPLGASHEALLEELGDKLELVRGEGSYFSKRVEELKPEPADLVALDAARTEAEQAVRTLERREAKIEQALKEQAEKERELAQLTSARDERAQAVQGLDAAYDAAHHAAVRATVATLGALEVEHAVAKGIADDLPARRVSLETVTRSLAAAQAAAAAARTAHAAHGFSDAVHAAARLAWESAQAQREKAAVQRRGSESDATNAAAALARAVAAAAQAARVREQQRQLEGERRVHDELDTAYGELRTELNARLRPELGEIAGSFLTDLTDDRYNEFELDENYEVILIGGGVPRQVISGGEEDLANLVLRLAISQLIAERSGQPFSLLVLDEVFGSLDDQRRQNVVELLRRLQDRFEQVIVITHIDGVRDGLDRVLEVSVDEATGRAVVESRDGGRLPAETLAGLEA
ncbi:MAG: SMC family ATPase [Gemmatimonadaceae bacterium]|nr:SMC family ATPase [Gemmatimonadaceae bacterium]